MKAKIKEELDKLLLKKYEYDLDMIREVYSLIKRLHGDAEEVKYFLERADVIGTSVNRDDKDAVRKMALYYDRYQALVHGITEHLANDNPEETEFYRRLWKFVEDSEFVQQDDEARLYVWFLVWREQKIPYFQMKEGISMSDEEFRKLSDSLTAATAKAEYLLRFPFNQKTQRCSQLVDLLDDCESQKEKCVLMVHILMLEDEVRETLMDKMLEVKRILDREK